MIFAGYEAVRDSPRRGRCTSRHRARRWQPHGAAARSRIADHGPESHSQAILQIYGNELGTRANGERSVRP